MSGGKSKVRCYKEQYCIGTWNVKDMNQGKLYMVQEKMVRLNIDILGIWIFSWLLYLLLWARICRRSGVALIVNKRIWNAIFGVQSQKGLNDLGSFPRQTLHHHSNPSLCTKYLTPKKLKLSSSMKTYKLY